jgi:cell shape-determining protein MreC
MIRLQQHKKIRRGHKPLFIIAVVALFLFVVLQLPFVSEFFSRTLFALAAPLWGAPALLYSETNSARTQELEQELVTLRMRSLSRELLLEENRALKALLGRDDTAPNTLLAVVLVRPNQTPYDTFILDVGSDENIREGLKVTVAGDVVIGEVEKVFAHTSRAKLYSSPGLETPVLLGADNIAAVAVGHGGGNFTIELPQGILVEEGDIVSLPSITTQVIGVVEVIEAHGGSSFQKIFLRSPISMQQLKWVQVLME